MSPERRDDSMNAGGHPTRERLISDTVELLDTHAPEEITTVMVLERSGVASGSLYHFFEDLSDLIEHAMLQRFAGGVNASISVIRRLIDESADAEDFISGLSDVTNLTQNPWLAPTRLERARMLAMAQHNERWRTVLAAVQQNLTDALTTCFFEAQAKGWLNREFSPRAGAVFIQAYTLGRIVDDIAETPMDQDDWIGLITLIVRRALGPRPD
jgi:AcrR family transcriptional regulator